MVLHSINPVYDENSNIYDLYKAIYKDENIEEIDTVNNVTESTTIDEDETKRIIEEMTEPKSTSKKGKRFK